MASSSSSATTPDEGEILDNGLSPDKATTPPSRNERAGVDRTNRHNKKARSSPNRRSGGRYDSIPSLTASPRHSTFSRSSRRRSPPRDDRGLSQRSRSRSPRGSKRSRDESYTPHDSGFGSRRSFHTHYENMYDERSQGTWYSRPRSRDRPDKLPRERSPPRQSNMARHRRELSSSRSPPRFDRDRKNGHRAKERPEQMYESGERELNAGKRFRNGSVGGGNGVLASVDKPQLRVRFTEPEKESEPEQEEPLDEAAQIEQRRKRREAIKAKHRDQQTSLLTQTLTMSRSSLPSTPATENDSGTPSSQTSASTSRQGSPILLAVSTDSDLANSSTFVREDEALSAADYDPMADVREARSHITTQALEEEISAAAYDETEAGRQDVLVPDSNTFAPPAATIAVEGDDGFDMFADQDDDMFADDPSPVESQAKQQLKAVPISNASKALDMSMLDDVDDPEGYYKVNLGELLDGRYQVQATLGRGMFSAVVRAFDQMLQKVVAIKMIRHNETMRKAAAKEIAILNQLNAADPDDRKHIVQLERSFEHKGHLCMVFENLSINLREILKKFGRDVGINIQAVRAYAHQMFLALSLLRKCNILHADLKPDNILVNEARTLLKVCDLGSASDTSENEITPYLVSRFYRAPEIILGMPLDQGIDMWSVGCTLFELYTGKILFTGRSNNQMLKAIIECRGKFPTRALRRAQLAGLHFEPDGSFRSVERDPSTGRDHVRVLPLVKPTRDLRQRVLAAGGGGTGGGTGKHGDEAKDLNLLIDLLDKCLILNPERRLTPTDALKHPFLQRKP